MVADLGIDEATKREPKAAAAKQKADKAEKRQSRRAKPEPAAEPPVRPAGPQAGSTPGESPEGAPTVDHPDRAADLSPEEVVMRDEKPRGSKKSKQPRRHGRPR
jgi:hypothetical protein